jgi:hypothetical protein
MASGNRHHHRAAGGHPWAWAIGMGTTADLPDLNVWLALTCP